MWADINGERKKVACGPCIRGHRSSKCEHEDRVLLEVRKPGRPLSSCPHPSGSCGCHRTVIGYTIPKSSNFACPSGQLSTANSNRVQKHRHRKSTTLNPATVEKALKSSESDKSTSNGGSPISSASSTPVISAPPPSKGGCCSNAKSQQSLPERIKPQPSIAQKLEALESAGCCGSKPVRSTSPQQGGSGSSWNAPKQLRQHTPAAGSCCSPRNGETQYHQYGHLTSQQSTLQQYGTFTHFPHSQHPFSPELQNGLPSPAHPGLPYMPGYATGGIPPLPYSFSMPVFNHLSQTYGSPPMTMQPPQRRPSDAPPAAFDYSCHCGDDCACFGCAAHPNNSTMTEYIRYMAQYQETGGSGSVPLLPYDMPTYSPQPEFGIHNYQDMEFGRYAQAGAFSQLPPPYMMDMNGLREPSDTQTNINGTWSHEPMQPVTAATQRHYASYPSQNSPREKQQLSLKIEEPVAPSSPYFTDSPGEDQGGMGTPIVLSPSRYVTQELVISEGGNCSDPTGTCQCGDGCICVGCLTHGGHNDVPFSSTISQSEELSTMFITHSDPAGHGPNPNEYIAAPFSGAPT